MARHVADRLVERRTALGLVTDHLAILLGVSRSTAGRYETGETMLDAATLYRACQVLRCEPGYFFDGLFLEPLPFPSSGLREEGVAFDHDGLTVPAIAEMGHRALKAPDSDRSTFLQVAERLLDERGQSASATESPSGPIPARVARLCVAAVADEGYGAIFLRTGQALLPESSIRRHKQN
ncbi:helix-turn-helix domain-containing protein [Brevundimonas lutea]|uniref:helix-turn-helix domain-containing protein n=1 Tax=Brevundimonas lutea TaxID=2293980 RepID=UPI0013CF2BF9|nr:helix-turn-helix transcriptional regulator [Brevundimonas lutea]